MFANFELKTENMKRVNVLIAALLLVGLVSCNETPKEKVSDKEIAPVKHGESMEHHSTTDSAARYSPEMVVNKRDFICGMPVIAGIADTAHYEGKVYGFCATECKVEFLQNPKAYIKGK